MSTLKKSVKSFVMDAYKAHENAKADLLKTVNNNQLTGTFGQVYVDDLMRAESLVNQFPLTPEYMDGEEFANTSEEEFRVWLVDFHRGLKARESEELVKGFDPKRAWYLSGASQLRVFLERTLAQYQ